MRRSSGHTVIAVAAISVAALAAGCANGGSAPVAEVQAPSEVERDDGKKPRKAPAKPTRKTVVKLQDSEYGPVLFDKRGGALYLFTADGTDRATCYGDCARAWPPFYARGKLRAHKGVDRGLLGKTERRDGRKQVTYAGQPLYYYVADPPNEILCHDVFEFGGDWLVVRASGEPAA